ncbi:MAG: sialidase family protein, partial [Armatimonadota bacterium]
MSDWRNIDNGYEIPAENYCDQPYVIVADDGAWVCTLTTGTGAEGGQKQHVIAARSTDHGEAWSEPVDIEPAGPPESSWVMPLKLPSGRIYAFYVYNKDNLREVIADQGTIKRVDTLGYYAFRYSDDNGKSWSDERYYIPVRETDIDRRNPYEGE